MRLTIARPGHDQTDCLAALGRQPDGDGVAPPCDGTAQPWWASVCAMQRSFSTAIARIAGDDADSFCSARVHIYTEAYRVVRDGTPVQPPGKAS